MKLIIVDDDSIIRRGLSSYPWEEYGIELVGSAGDGEEGLELIESMRPDLVITDIRMPFMDGLDMIRAAKDRFPDQKMIIMTSFEEFELAKQALELRVFEFVLKPVEKKAMLEIVRKAARELEQERSVRRKVKEAQPLLRQQFLEGLIRGKWKEDDIAAKVSQFELPLGANRFVVILLKADEYKVSDYQARFGKDMLKFSIHNIAEELLNGEGRGVAFDSYEDELVILFSGDESDSELMREAYAFGEKVLRSVETYLKTTVTVGIGSPCGALKDIAGSYADALTAFEFRHIVGPNNVLTANDARPAPAAAPKAVDIGLMNELVLKAKLGLWSDAQPLLQQIERGILNASAVSLQQVRLIALEIAIQVFRHVSEPQEGESGGHTPFGSMDALYQSVERVDTVKEIFGVLREFVFSVTLFVNEQRNNHQKSVVMKAMEYIESHYYEEGLSLQDVASAVHVSPAYLSVLFKQVKNVNFSDFLLDVRMKKAMELLRKEDLKTYEAGQRVGYPNPQYFSVIFKKYNGVSPKQFKSKQD